MNSCSIPVKEVCYKMMVRPILEYTSPVWSPSTELNILKLKMVQRRAARFVLNDFFMLLCFQNARAARITNT